MNEEVNVGNDGFMFDHNSTIPPETTNISGIIKIEIQKGEKIVTASMYLENYLKVKKLHQISLGDDMIDSLINELKD